MKTFVLVNPKARNGGAGEDWQSREAAIRKALGEGLVEVGFTRPDDFGTGIVREKLKEGFDRIVVVGGDGSLAEAMRGFFDERTREPIRPSACLALMPSGRGNDFLKSVVGPYVSLPQIAWEKGLELLRAGAPKAIDLIDVEFATPDARRSSELCINLCSFGCPGIVVERVQQASGWVGKTRLGRSAASYVMQTLAALREYRPVPVRISVDGRVRFEGKIFSGAVLNGRFNAAGFCWSDQARIDDGLLHLTVLEARSLLGFLPWLPRMGTGAWDGISGVTVASGREIVVEDLSGPGERSRYLCEVDGDLPEPPETRRITFRVRTAALRFWSEASSDSTKCSETARPA